MSFHAGQGMDGVRVDGGISGISQGKRWLAGGLDWEGGSRVQSGFLTVRV